MAASVICESPPMFESSEHSSPLYVQVLGMFEFPQCLSSLNFQVPSTFKVPSMFESSDHSRTIFIHILPSPRPLWSCSSSPRMRVIVTTENTPKTGRVIPKLGMMRNVVTQGSAYNMKYIWTFLNTNEQSNLPMSHEIEEETVFCWVWRECVLPWRLAITWINYMALS